MAATLQPPFPADQRAAQSPGPMVWCGGIPGAPSPQYRPMCCLCCCPVLLAVPAALGFAAVSLYAYSVVAAKVAAVVVTAIVLAFLCFMVLTCSAKEGRGAREGAEVLFDATRGLAKASALPERLRGVFWMSDNALPELLVKLEGEPFDPERQVLSLRNGWPYNWSWDSDPGGAGWVEWACITICGVINCSTIRFQFDAMYSMADIAVTMCGCINLAKCCCQRWTMTDISPAGQPAGNVWARDTYLCGNKVDRFSYTLRKVIDGRGEKIQPAFDVMIDSLAWPGHPGVLIKGVTVKTLAQVQQGPLCGQAQVPRQEEMRYLVA